MGLEADGCNNLHHKAPIFASRMICSRLFQLATVPLVEEDLAHEEDFAITKKDKPFLKPRINQKTPALIS